jgi:hypothetical protein
MGRYARVDYNLTLLYVCPLQSRLQYIYHGQSYARVDLNPMPEVTLSTSQGLWIWPLDSYPRTNSVMWVNPACNADHSRQRDTELLGELGII